MSLPAGPRAPALVQTAEWIARPLPFLDRCARRYGDAFTLRLLGAGDIVLLSTPEAVKQVFTANPDELHAGEANSILRSMLGPGSLLLLDGPSHLRHRRLLLPPFHGERMQVYGQAMRDIADASLDTWPLDRPFALQPFLQGITLQVILRTVFGLEEGPRFQHLSRLVSRLLDLLSPPTRLLPVLLGIDMFQLLPWARASRLKAEMDDELYAEIGRRRGALDRARRQDILSLMLDARDEEGRPLSDGEVRDELVTLLLAGHETTATALAWTFERILATPDVERRVRDELGERELDRLDYLDAVIRESLRVRPIVPMVVRLVKSPFRVGPYLLPTGALVSPCIYLTQRRPDIYPEPDAFRPERFLGRKVDPYAWLPFGGGIRRCLGMSFALYEMRVVLAAVLSRARLALAPGTPAAAVRRGITIAPSGGTRVRLLERRAAPRAA